MAAALRQHQVQSGVNQSRPLLFEHLSHAFPLDGCDPPSSSKASSGGLKQEHALALVQLRHALVNLAAQCAHAERCNYGCQPCAFLTACSSCYTSCVVDQI